jgi:hypothetical protein
MEHLSFSLSNQNSYDHTICSLHTIMGQIMGGNVHARYDFFLRMNFDDDDNDEMIQQNSINKHNDSSLQ